MDSVPGNYSIVELEGVRVSPKDEADDYGAAFSPTILDACTDCQIDYSVNETEAMSFSLDHRYLKAKSGRLFPDPFNKHKINWQQTSSFPDPDTTEDIVRLIGRQMPSLGSPDVFVAQLSNGPASTK